MFDLVLVTATVVLALTTVGATESEAVEGFDFKSYHDYPDFEWYITSVARRYPHISTLKVIGTSREGRKLLGLKIGKPSNVSKPAVWIDGGNHAREWPAFHVCIFFIDRLLTGYGKIPKFTEYIEKLNIYVFPVLNPDGFIFSRTSTKDAVRQWRKNMAPDNCTGFVSFKRDPTCCNGVDLNRNWDVGFRQNNYPFNNPCSDEFQGPHPFSEPETIAMRDFVLSPEINGKVKAMVSLHTHGQLFIIPYNFNRKTYPEDYADLEGVARRAAAAIASYRDTEYRVGTAADMLGPATGGAIDWIKMNTLIKYVYVLELPPELNTWFAFQMKPHWLVPTAKETWQGIEVIIRQVMREFPTV